MRASAIAVVGVLVLTVSVRAQAGIDVKEAAKRELQRLQGGWRVEALETNGEKTAADDLKERTVFIGGDAFLVRDRNKILQVAKLKLDPTKSPRTVNAQIMQGPSKGDVMLGIYEVQGDTLRICFDQDGGNRPKEYKTTANSNLTVIVCKRIPPSDKGLPDITGPYESSSVELDGSRHTSEATIERHGDAYLVTYRKNGAVAYVGIGIRSGNIFSMCWASQGQVGLSVYQIEKGPRLIGQYTQLGGVGMSSQETLTARDKSD